MKTILFFVVLFLCPTISNAASYCYAAACISEGPDARENNSYYFLVDFFDGTVTDPGCFAPLSVSCYGTDARVYSCDSICKSGYTKTQVTNITLGSCAGLSFYYCKVSCVNTCTIGSTESCLIINGTGTRSVVGGDSCGLGCTYSACAVTSCKAGYYKKSSTECASCATDTGVANATSTAGNSAGITDCYIPSGTSFTDSTGNGSYTGNCNYSN